MTIRNLSLPTPENQRLYKALIAVPQGATEVLRFGDDGYRVSIDELALRETPKKDLTTYVTLGFSNETSGKHGLPRGTGVELSLVGRTSARDLANVLSTIVFCIVNDDYPCHEGAVFPNALGMYSLSKTVVHAVLTSPITWSPPRKVLGKAIHWLQVLPISEYERSQVVAGRYRQLISRLKRERVDLTDLSRHSLQ